MWQSEKKFWELSLNKKHQTPASASFAKKISQTVYVNILLYTLSPCAFHKLSRSADFISIDSSKQNHFFNKFLICKQTNLQNSLAYKFLKIHWSKISREVSVSISTDQTLYFCSDNCVCFPRAEQISLHIY